MNCPHCRADQTVQNGTSRHGHQRWRCQKCQTTFGENDRRLVAPETKAAALAQDLEGGGQRATERLLGVSHNAIANWVKKAVAGQVLKATPAEKVEWVEADELGTCVAKKKTMAGSGGLLIVLPNASWAGRWGDRGTATAERLEARLPHAPHLIFATDFWHPYAKIFRQANPVQGKVHTFTVESLNNRIRCYLARLKRRTHSYSKSKQKLAASIWLFIIQKCGGELAPARQSIPI
jgi:insertion element IS1 protein InsB